MHKSKHLVILLLLTAILAIFFWTDSRYPALNEKALMGAETNLSGIGFNTVLEISSDDSILTKISYTAINWADTNRQGMIFGILFAALILTLFPFFKGVEAKNRFKNSFAGSLLGAPLGVCVNCATPIAKAILSGGGRLETMLATLTSSPTMNIIVITMLFTLLPFYMAVIKIALTLVFILLAIPLITHFSPVCAVNPTLEKTLNIQTPFFNQTLPKNSAGSSWLTALTWVARHSCKNLWFIIKTTVPLMLLAGLLGAAVITLFPFQSLSSIMPEVGSWMSLIWMGALVMFGIFLPIPMAFDVIITLVLLQSGLQVQYAMALLFTLGIFSIYPFLMIWRDVSRKTALSIVATLLGLGMIAGVAAHQSHLWEIGVQKDIIAKAFSHSEEGPKAKMFFGNTPSINEKDLVASLQNTGVTLKRLDGKAPDNISVYSMPFQPKKNTTETLFSRLDSKELGLTPPYQYSLLKTISPFTELRGIAAGDVHNDGWIDLVICTESGLYLYANDHGKRFIMQQLDIDKLKNLHVFNSSLVDLNNDGFLDIYFSTYRQGNFAIYNQKGLFGSQKPVQLPNHAKAIFTASTGFADIDLDGDLDIVLGNSFFITHFAPEQARNILLESQGQSFRIHFLPGTPGNSLSVLLSDFNNDQKPDLIIGNDFEGPDIFYTGNGTVQFKQVHANSNVIPVSTKNTMSITTADLNNDLRMEIFLAQVGKRSSDFAYQHTSIKPCKGIRDKAHLEACQYTHTIQQEVSRASMKEDVKQCNSLTHKEYQRDCIARVALNMSQAAGRSGFKPTCDQFPDDLHEYAFICNQMQTAEAMPVLADPIPQKQFFNVLLSADAEGKFTNNAEAMGLKNTRWTWNATFADIDNDEWMDLYVANGYSLSLHEQTPDLFFRNMKGSHFVEKSKTAGLVGGAETSSYVYIDFDNDGDIDIVTLSQFGDVTIYRNNTQKNHAIEFQLRDHKGNRFGIGSKIIIHYGSGRHQVRELKSSGGFVSYNAPIAHFGLSQFGLVDRVKIIWSTGETSELQGPFKAGERFTISRGT